MFGFPQFFSENTFVSHTTLALNSSLFNVAHLFRGALKAAAVQITVVKFPYHLFAGAAVSAFGYSPRFCTVVSLTFLYASLILTVCRVAYRNASQHLMILQVAALENVAIIIFEVQDGKICSKENTASQTSQIGKMTA